MTGVRYTQKQPNIRYSGIAELKSRRVGERIRIEPQIRVGIRYAGGAGKGWSAIFHREEWRSEAAPRAGGRKRTRRSGDRFQNRCSALRGPRVYGRAKDRTRPGEVGESTGAWTKSGFTLQSTSFYHQRKLSRRRPRLSWEIAWGDSTLLPGTLFSFGCAGNTTD